MVKIFHVSKSSNCQFRLFMAIDIFNVNGFFLIQYILVLPLKANYQVERLKC